MKDLKIKVSSTVDFPFGTSLTETKALEAFRAVKDGAKELDMVANLSILKSNDCVAAKRDIEVVLKIKRLTKGIIVKIIIEALKPIRIGANRIGTSSAAETIKGAP